MGGWFMAQCSIRVTLLCWCIDAMYYGGNILQWYIDSKHGCNQQQHYGIALSTFTFFLFYVPQMKTFGVMPLWHCWCPQKEKILISLRVTLGPAAPFSWCAEGVGCCPHWGQPNGVDRLWPPPAAQLEAPGSICSPVSGGLPMPLKQKRLPDPSCGIASTPALRLLAPSALRQWRTVFVFKRFCFATFPVS